jgi:type II secretion system (T2SS) protein E
MKLGSWLIARGRITGVQLKRALLDQSFYGCRLSSSLMKLGYLDEETLGEYLSDLFHVPYAPLEKFQNIPPEVLRMIPESLARKHLLVPLGIHGKKILVAMMNPGDILVMDEVAFLTGLQVETCVSSEDHLLDALERHYNLPRVVRETIPIAGRTESDQEPRSAAPPEEKRPSPPPAPETEAVEMGLDGRPLPGNADAVPEVLSRQRPILAPATASEGPRFPRNMEEWRAADEALPLCGTPPVEESVPGPPMAPPPSSISIPSSRHPAAAKPPLSLVPPPASQSLEEASLHLRDSSTRDEVFQAVLDFCGGRFTRSALFLVTQEKVVGWSGRGDGFDEARIRATTVPFGVPSIFSYFRMGSEFYFGPVPALPANQEFYQKHQLAPPERVLLVPIQIKGRLIALLYGDYGSGGMGGEPDIATFRRLAQKASLALEILVLRNKISML